MDLGTATTISLIDEKKNYAGGMILPGVATALEALTEKTSQLPKISIEQPRKAIGKNTVDCMKSGIIYGSAACIDGMIDRIEPADPYEYLILFSLQVPQLLSVCE